MEKFKCVEEGCEKSYKTKANLVRHVKEKHQENVEKVESVQE
jgi:hypothetical protein